MKCQRCSFENENGLSICSNCGSNLVNQPELPQEVVEQGDATGGVIPYKNPLALTSYYLGIFSIIPCLGVFLGFVAVILGILGLKAKRENPHIKGSVHAIVGIVCGGIFGLIWFVFGVLPFITLFL